MPVLGSESMTLDDIGRWLDQQETECPGLTCSGPSVPAEFGPRTPTEFMGPAMATSACLPSRPFEYKPEQLFALEFANEVLGDMSWDKYMF